jgi:hypothetical protein
MPRKKNYAAPVSRSVTARQEWPDGSSRTAEAVESGIDESGQAVKSVDSERGSPDVDMVELLGPDTEFSTSLRTIVLHPHLGRGIDEWVWATSESIKTLLLAGRSTASGQFWRCGMLKFYDFLVQGAVKTTDGIQLMPSRPATPSDLSPLHVAQFGAYVMKQGEEKGSARGSVRGHYQSTKSILQQMFSLGYIPGEAHRFFKRGMFKHDGESGITSLSDAEQERLATAIKEDLSAIHHGRLQVTMRELQALRLLVVAHRMGHNTTPLLSLARDAMKPGLVPGTVLVQTAKRRASKVTSQVGSGGSSAPTEEDYLPFGLAEGAVIQQALTSSEHLVARAPKRLRNRVWLFEVSHTGRRASKGEVSCLSDSTLLTSIKSLVKRHDLQADDGQPLVINLSRLRKSRFERAFRLSNGDVAVTANLMGNSPAVAATNYPSMNLARQAEAAGFMNEDYIGQIRGAEGPAAKGAGPDTVLRVVPIQVATQAGTATPVAGCADALDGEHAPKTGQPCDRFVMCLFCSSFAVVGTVDELWRLFSFQAFARVELAYLDDRLGPLQEGVEATVELLDLRDRYRLAIPYIDTFTAKQFTASRVEQARAKTAAGLHPFWTVQMQLSRRARLQDLEGTDLAAAAQASNKHGLEASTDQADIDDRPTGDEEGKSYGT